MKISRRTVLNLGVALGFGVAASGLSMPVQAWEPVKPIDLVVMAGKGGGADQLARFIQSIVEKNNLASKPLIPNNKGGGSGAEALVHVNSAKDPDHTLLVTLNSFYTTPLRQPGLGVDIMKFTPVARMAEDTFLLWVHTDSGVKTFDDFKKAVTAANGEWIMAGTGKAQEDELITDFLMANYGLKIKYVPYQGGGDVAKQLAGKHANSTVNNPSEIKGFYEAGQAIPIAAFTGKRLELFPNAPTMKELGQDFEYYMQRSVVGAPGMSADAQKYYSDLFKKVFDSEDWQAYRKKQALQGEFLTGDALKKYWDVNNKTHIAMLKKMGALK